MSKQPLAGQENALAGVKYGTMKKFKDRMKLIIQLTRHLPSARQVRISPGGGPVYMGEGRVTMPTVLEGLGNKALVAEILNYLKLEDPTGLNHYGGIGVDAVMMAVIDLLAKGALPIACNDEVTVGNGDWLSTPQAAGLAESFYKAFLMTGSALLQGETAPYAFLMKTDPPIQYAPSISVSATGIAPAGSLLTGGNVQPGDVMIGIPSHGLMSNGFSVFLRRVKASKDGLDGYLKPLGATTVGQQSLRPTRCFVQLVEQLLSMDRKNIHAIQPVTGGGIAKIAAANRRFRYIIGKNDWIPEETWPPIFHHLMELGVTRRGMVETFNCGVGLAVIVPKKYANHVVDIANDTIAGDGSGYYGGKIIGEVRRGKPGTWFGPWNMSLDLP